MTSGWTNPVHNLRQKTVPPKHLSCDMEYQDYRRLRPQRGTALRATLTADQNERLDALLGEQFIYHSAELEAMFAVRFLYGT